MGDPAGGDPMAMIARLSGPAADALLLVVRRDAPELLGPLLLHGVRGIHARQRAHLRGLVERALVRDGFEKGGKPNALGIALEDALDAIGSPPETT